MRVSSFSVVDRKQSQEITVVTVHVHLSQVPSPALHGPPSITLGSLGGLSAPPVWPEYPKPPVRAEPNPQALALDCQLSWPRIPLVWRFFPGLYLLPHHPPACSQSLKKPNSYGSEFVRLPLIAAAYRPHVAEYKVSQTLLLAPLTPPPEPVKRAGPACNSELWISHTPAVPQNKNKIWLCATLMGAKQKKEKKSRHVHSTQEPVIIIFTFID